MGRETGLLKILEEAATWDTLENFIFEQRFLCKELVTGVPYTLGIDASIFLNSIDAVVEESSGLLKDLS
ncbi:hypothetical protein Moror_15959 [Moniliophthora roreri MCA 2997]|uniref:Uncharacterized protein n=1 Tax=Moniliophthora roreri (strain MCA 2997) TaxID=1381753 RepID=V2XIQ5_MONRO|nr:hypothetical protein Moror_15959 [Moniliophthora roreri MCA 2997]